MIKKSCKIEVDEITAKFASAFDYDFDGTSHFNAPEFNPPEDFEVGLIVGNSGSGKTLMLKEYFNLVQNPAWDKNKSIVSHFDSFEKASEKLFAVGLSSVPTLCKPYHVLSNGESYRADIARIIDSKVAIDEFTSVVNRETAYALCVSIRKYIRKNGLRNIVFASCHFDIVDWLEPDWVFSTNLNSLDINKLSLDKFPKLGEFNVN